MNIVIIDTCAGVVTKTYPEWAAVEIDNEHISDTYHNCTVYSGDCEVLRKFGLTATCGCSVPSVFVFKVEDRIVNVDEYVDQVKAILCTE